MWVRGTGHQPQSTQEIPALPAPRARTLLVPWEGSPVVDMSPVQNLFHSTTHQTWNFALCGPEQFIY